MHALEAHLDVYRQPRLAGVLEAGAAAGIRLDQPVYVGCLLQDAGLSAWHLTALFDPDSNPMDATQFGIPHGGFLFTLPTSLTPRPLREVFTEGWGEVACASLAAHLDVDSAICVPIIDADGPRGALVAFLRVGENAPLLVGVLVHAATAASRYLHENRIPAAEDVLPPAGLTERATNELARAERYQRPVSVVAFELAHAADVANFAPPLLRSLRHWDFLGRLDSDPPALIAVLPETSRSGARGIIKRMSQKFGTLTAGAAVFPDDAGGWVSLVELARGRAIRGTSPFDEARSIVRVARVWRRGAAAGPDGVVIRCPVCLIPYTYRPVTSAATLADDDADRARAMLRAACPHHQERMTA